MQSPSIIFNQNNMKSILKVSEKYAILSEVRSTIISYNIYSFFPSWLNYGNQKRRKKRYIHLISPKKRLQRLHDCFTTTLYGYKGGHKSGNSYSINPKHIPKLTRVYIPP
jgi:hypothetical protein